MRTRKTAAPKKTPPTKNTATKSTGETPAAKRTPASKTRNAKNIDALPLSDSNPDQSPQEHNSLASASTTNSAKRKIPGRPRTKLVAATPNLEEQLEEGADETLIVDNSEAADKDKEPENVEVVDADNIESENEGEQGVGSVGLSDEREPTPMGVDEPVIEKVCEVIEKGKNMVDVEVPVSFKQPGCTVVDLNIYAADKEVYAGAKEEEEELKIQEGEIGREELKEQEREKGKEELSQQKREKEIEEFKEQEGEKAKEELREEGDEKGNEELKEEGEEKGKEELKEEGEEKGKEELNQQKREDEMEEFKEREGEKEKEELVQPKIKKEMEEFKVQEGEKGKEELQEYGRDKEMEDCRVQEGEQGKREIVEEDSEEDPEEDPEEEYPEETETLEEEHMELEAIAKQQKIKREHEIFVGGLDRDATEEDLRKVFKWIGEVVEIRLHKDSSTNKNKGYAFVKFTSKEHAQKALSEMKNPVIRGKRCGTAPSEDNDTLFLGNICNTWTKEAIKQKLKDYGIEGVEDITLVPDAQHEGLSRGFAFLEFSCHGDAMVAYKRLQKPDVIFGHAERTAKVAFAEPAREPDPEIMAQVKSVFINGIPPHWDEDHLRELFKSYGDIVRIVLGWNISTAKRKDYGFVDFSTHEAAVACVDGVNKSELGDGASKIKVKARLSNPLPKTQAVKGGMCGGFQIGRARGGAFPRPGRGFGRGRGRQPFSNRGNFNRDRDFYHYDRHSEMGRMGFRDHPDFNMYPDFHQRQFGPQGVMRGGHYAGSRGAAFAGPSRHHHDRAWYGIPDGVPGEPIPPRRPYSPGGKFDAPFMGRHFDDPYLYDGNLRGMKRPFYISDPEPDYMGPNRLRPRLDYADPSRFHGTQHYGYAGPSSRPYPHDYYGSDYGGGPYSSFHGRDGPHGHGYYY